MRSTHIVLFVPCLMCGLTMATGCGDDESDPFVDRGASTAGDGDGDIDVDVDVDDDEDGAGEPGPTVPAPGPGPMGPGMVDAGWMMGADGGGLSGDDGMVRADGGMGADPTDAAVPEMDAATEMDAAMTVDAMVDDAMVDGGSQGCAGENPIELPEGFCASEFAAGLGRARHIATTPSGDVFVAVTNGMDDGTVGGIIGLRDTDGDGVADQVERFHDDGGNGIAWQDGILYFAENDRVVRYALPDGELVPEADPVTVVEGLPDTGDHPYKTIVVDEDVLYVNIGSATNACQADNREPGSPGLVPCPELATRAGVWRFDAEGSNQGIAQGIPVVTGARNLTALTMGPDDELYAVQNGRDQLSDNWPDLYTPEQDAQLPAEEMFRLEPGADYGWPDCYYDGLLEEKVLAPEYGGNGTTVAGCVLAADPIAIYPAHWAPLSIVFYTGTTFPERYVDGALIAFHGSRFEPQAQGMLPGYNVVYQPFSNGEPTGEYEVFASGFAGEGRPLPAAAEHRPVGLAFGPDDALYISDDQGGSLYRVTYDAP